MRVGEPPLQRPAGRVADRGGVGQDLLHPLVRRELLALDDADRGELAGELHVVAGRRLVLDVGVDHLEEAVVARRDGVERRGRCASMNFVSGIFGSPASRTAPVSAWAMLVP